MKKISYYIRLTDSNGTTEIHLSPKAMYVAASAIRVARTTRQHNPAAAVELVRCVGQDQEIQTVS